MKPLSRLIFLTLTLSLLLPSAALPQEVLSPPERKVRYVIDGDTLLLYPNEKVRLIGIDTMEIHDGEKLTRQARIYQLKEKEVKKQGKKSRKIVEKLLKGKQVRLVPGREARDDYGRTLAYVFFTLREDKLAKIVGQKYLGPRPPQEKEYMLDRVMVQYGWAEALTRYPFDYLDEFVELQNHAKENHWGMWKKITVGPGLQPGASRPKGRDLHFQ